ncbi:hypothetical protein Tco_0281328 [Tanacetum coccineum]
MDMDMEEDSKDKMDGPELIFPYEAVGSPNPPPPESDTSSESEPEDDTATILRDRESRRRIDLLDFDLGVVEHNKDKIKHVVVTLDECVQKLEDDAVRGENMRLRMMLRSAEEGVMFAERDLYELRV